jgi:ubiquitin C-terminal hydrolase
MAPVKPAGDRIVTWTAGIAALAALAYVFLGTPFNKPRKLENDRVPGLFNVYGNDCFANCVIQVYNA